MSIANATRKLAEVVDVVQLLSFDDEVVVSETVKLGELWMHVTSSLRSLRILCALCVRVSFTQRTQRIRKDCKEILLAWFSCERREQYGDRIDTRRARIEVARIVVDHDREREL